MFAAGETVRVKDAWPEATGPVHIRTPHYVRGVVGRGGPAPRRLPQP